MTIPDSLRELDRWAVWRREDGQKVPYRVTGRGRASSTDPRDWGTAEDALRTLKTGRYAGLAFAFFLGDGLVGIDLDNCLDAAGKPKPWAQGTLERFSQNLLGNFAVRARRQNMGPWQTAGEPPESAMWRWH